MCHTHLSEMSLIRSAFHCSPPGKDTSIKLICKKEAQHSIGLRSEQTMSAPVVPLQGTHWALGLPVGRLLPRATGPALERNPRANTISPSGASWATKQAGGTSLLTRVRRWAQPITVILVGCGSGRGILRPILPRGDVTYANLRDPDHSTETHLPNLLP